MESPSIVGGIQIYPLPRRLRNLIALTRKIDRHPGMRGLGALVVGSAAQVAAHVPRGQPHRSQRADHHVREVLTHSLARAQGLEHRGVDGGGVSQRAGGERLGAREHAAGLHRTREGGRGCREEREKAGRHRDDEEWEQEEDDEEEIEEFDDSHFERTEWFPKKVKPVRNGFYEVTTKGWPFPHKTEWKDGKWVLGNDVNEWRGITEKQYLENSLQEIFAEHKL